MAKKKTTGGQSSSKAKNTAKGKEKNNRPDGEFEKLLEEVDKPKAGKSAKGEKEEKDNKTKKEAKPEAKKEDKKQTSIKAKAEEKKKAVDDGDDDDDDDGNFSFVSMFLAIIAIVLAVKILLNYNDLSSKNRVLQDRVESIDEALDRNNANLEKKFAKLSAKLKMPVKKKDKVLAKKVFINQKMIAGNAKVLSEYETKLNHLEDVVFTSNNFQAALELKSALDRLDDLSTWVTGDSKRKVDDVRSKVIDLITSLEHGSDAWQPTAFRMGRFNSSRRVPTRPARTARKPLTVAHPKKAKPARKVAPKRKAQVRKAAPSRS